MTVFKNSSINLSFNEFLVFKKKKEKMSCLEESVKIKPDVLEFKTNRNSKHVNVLIQAYQMLKLVKGNCKLTIPNDLILNSFEVDIFY